LTTNAGQTVLYFDNPVNQSSDAPVSQEESARTLERFWKGEAELLMSLSFEDWLGAVGEVMTRHERRSGPQEQTVSAPRDALEYVLQHAWPDDEIFGFRPQAGVC